MSAGKKWGLTGPYNGLYMVTTPMPFPLKTSNGFIAESAQGWVVIDGGVSTETNQQIWESALKDIGITWSQLSAIYLTHYHHDHLGLAGWMQRKAEIPVYIAAEDAVKVNHLLLLSAQGYADKFEAECSHHSWNNEYQQQLAADIAKIFFLLEPLPELSLLPSDHHFIMAGYNMNNVSVPGHSDGHQVFVGNNEILLSGDNLLANYQLHATDWPHNLQANPLQRFLSAMVRLEKLPIKQVLPGHGPVFTNFSERLHLLFQHHFSRIILVAEKLTQPMTAWELAQKVYPAADYIHIKRLMLAETLAYLQLMENRRLVTASQHNGLTIYKPAFDSSPSLTMQQLFFE